MMDSEEKKKVMDLLYSVCKVLVSSYTNFQ